MTTNQIFEQGYGKIRQYVVKEFGMDTLYTNNPNMTRAERKKAPVYIIPATEEMIKTARMNKVNSEKSQPRPISIASFAKKFIEVNGGKKVHESKSGSVYIILGDKSVRISNHYILDRDPMNPKVRQDVEIVSKVFTESDAVPTMEELLND